MMNKDLYGKALIFKNYLHIDLLNIGYHRVLQRPYRLLVFFFVLGLFNHLSFAKNNGIENGLSLEKYKLPSEPYHMFYGSRIHRTMSLLETSNAEHPSTVRILFYGQSIVAGMEAEKIIGKLKSKYPTVHFEYKNLAIGGFQAPKLVRTAVHDLYPYYPDLVIFHVYGGTETGDLERILVNIKKFTTSEVILFNHHVAWFSDPLELDRRTLKDDLESDCIEQLAQKYNYEFVDVRSFWKTFLDLNHNVNINTLMGDTVHTNVHPNKLGNELLRYCILQHFNYNPYLNSRAFQRIRDFEAKRNLVENDDEMTLDGKYQPADEGVLLEKECELHMDFIGNKIELFGFSSDHLGELEVMIDNKKPSQIRELYSVTRPSKAYDNWMPALKRVSFGTAFPVIEDYTLTLFNFNRDSALFDFKLHGSKTGYDGSGSNKSDFLSDSERIRIECDDFNIFHPERISKSETPENFEISFKVEPLFNDTLVVNGDKKRVLIAQGLENTRHTLKLKVLKGRIALKNIRIYSPELKASDGF